MPTTPDRGKRALAPVIGAALLVVIVVAMGVIVGGMFLGFGDMLNEPAPMVTSDGRIQLGIDNGTITEQDLLLVHRGRTEVDTSNVEILIQTGGETVRTQPSDVGDVADGRWSTGEELPIPLDTEAVCSNVDTLGIRVVYRGQTSTIIGERSVPIVRGGFTIENGAVVPVSEYSATAEVLGAGLTYGAGGPRIDIRLAFQIGNDTYEPWPGNVNNEGNPRSHTFSDQPPGAAIAVAATRDKNGVYVAPQTRWSNETDGWVYVLRDGDTPPNLAGFGDQDSAAAYVAPYLDEEGNISLDDNQAIYLFELGNSQSGSSGDYQDVVVLVSLSTQQETTSIVEISSDRSAVVCPVSD